MSITALAETSIEQTRLTLIATISVSLVCSILVSASAVVLKPRQLDNQELFRQRIVLEVAGLYEPGIDIGEAFTRIEPRLVELETGAYSDIADPATFDAAEAASDPELGIEIPAAEDIAVIRRRARFSPVYVVFDDDVIQQVILPVHGAGLWSTMYGFLALEPDGRTIRGLQFYEHAETAGLGDQVDRPEWRAQWAGKRLFNDDGSPAVRVVKGQAQPGSDYQIDGLSGATLTARGVTNLVHYWVGPTGFGPYLDRLAREAGGNE